MCSNNSIIYTGMSKSYHMEKTEKKPAARVNFRFSIDESQGYFFSWPSWPNWQGIRWCEIT